VFRTSDFMSGSQGLAVPSSRTGRTDTAQGWPAGKPVRNCLTAVS
jgi:hypothetical protein